MGGNTTIKIRRCGDDKNENKKNRGNSDVCLLKKNYSEIERKL
jgi:hypothetical protein